VDRFREHILVARRGLDVLAISITRGRGKVLPADLELDDSTDISPAETLLWFLGSCLEKAIGYVSSWDISSRHEDNIGFAKRTRSLGLLHLLAIDLENKLVGRFAETTNLTQVLEMEKCDIGGTYKVRPGV